MVVLAGLAGCSSGNRGQTVDRQVSKGLEPAPRAATGPANDERPLMLVNGEPVRWDAFRGRLIESAGASIVEEIALERALERECAKKGVVVTPGDIAAERDLFAQTLVSTGAMSTPNTAAATEVLESVRHQRGLGDERFAGLLRRTAMLRRLVQPDVAVTPAAIDQAYAMRYGERYRARLIIVPTAAEATAALARIHAGEAFDTVATQVSTDLSAARGGLLDEISPVDPSWPTSLRDALAKLKNGEVSPAFGVDNGFALVKLEERIDLLTSAPSVETVRSELEREVRLRQERLLMPRLARRLLSETDISVADPKLRDAWDKRGP